MCLETYLLALVINATVAPVTGTPTAIATPTVAGTATPLEVGSNFIRYEGRTLFGENLGWFDGSKWREYNLTWRPDRNGSYTVEHRVRIKAFGGKFGRIEIVDSTGAGISWRLPKPVRFSQGKITYGYDGVKWEYEATNEGVKSYGRVNRPKGAATYTFDYDRLGGLGPLSVDSDGDAVSGSFVVRRPSVLCGNGTVRMASPWRIVDENTVAFDFNDSNCPVPYFIDPTSGFPVTPHTNDAVLTGVGSTYPPPTPSNCITGTHLEVANSLVVHYYTKNSVMRWDTSPIPDSEVPYAARLRFRVFGRSSRDNLSMHCQWYKWHPCGGDDYCTNNCGTSNGSKLITSLSTSGTGLNNTIDFMTGINPSNIPVAGGYTEVRCYATGTIPTRSNYVNINASESGLSTSPLLEVDHGTPTYSYTPTATPTATPTYTAAFTNTPTPQPTMVTQTVTRTPTASPALTPPGDCLGADGGWRLESCHLNIEGGFLTALGPGGAQFVPPPRKSIAFDAAEISTKSSTCTKQEEINNLANKDWTIRCSCNSQSVLYGKSLMSSEYDGQSVVFEPVATIGTSSPATITYMFSCYCPYEEWELGNLFGTGKPSTLTFNNEAWRVKSNPTEAVKCGGLCAPGAQLHWRAAVLTSLCSGQAAEVRLTEVRLKYWTTGSGDSPVK